MYVERDGGFVLDVDGVAEISKLDEFRTNNVALLKELDDLKKGSRGSSRSGCGNWREKRRLEEAHAVRNGEVEREESR